MDAIVLTAGHRYEVFHDIVSRRVVFARGAVTDDASDLAIAPPFAVAVDEPLLAASDHESGYALAGDWGVALADTSIAHSLTVTIAASGYRPGGTMVTVPAVPVLPVDAPVALRRLPVRLTGRVVAAADGAGVPGARLALTGPALPAPAHPILLATPLAADLSPAAGLQGHAVTVLASPVPVKTAQAAAAGNSGIVLDDLQSLAPGQLLRCGPPERAHWVEIATLPGAPGLVRLTAPLAISLRAGDPVEPFALSAAAGPAAAPIGNAFAGEGVIIADAVPGGDVLAITDPPAPQRYQGLDAIAGPDGDYAIAGLARLESVRLTVTAAGFTSQSRSLPLPRSGAAARLDWRLLP